MGLGSVPTVIVANSITSGFVAQLNSSGAGTATGDVTSNPAQSVIIPLSLMQVHRVGDGGVPIPGPY
jgi:hypothetical protein